MGGSRLNRKLLVVFILVVVALMIATIVIRVNYKREKDIYKVSDKLQIHGLVLKKPRIIKDFSLTTSQGQSFTKENLRGHWTLMFFGFTHCGYVCPTTLSALKQMIKNLKQTLPGRLIPRVVMVSLDPKRDTEQVMQKYVSSFNPDFVGVRADLSQVSQLTRQMDISFVKVDTKNNNYMLNHSSEILVLDPNGNLRAFFSFPHKAQELTHDYESIMSSLKVKD